MPKGGKREGAGRKPLSGEAMKKTSITLDEDTIQLVNQYRETVAYQPFSEAVRTIIRSYVTDRLGLNYHNLEKPANPEDRIDF